MDRLAPGAAVVGTASGTHDPEDLHARRFGFRAGLSGSAASVARGDLDPGATERQAAADRYATSKLCNIRLTAGRAARVPAGAARFLALDPGLMPGTGLARERSAGGRFGWRCVLPVLGRAIPGVSSPARSGSALAALLTDRALPSGARLDHRPRAETTSPDSRRRDLAEELPATSAALCGVADARD